jgi:hypothetical protein
MVDPDDITDEVYYSELKLLFNTRGWQIHIMELQDQAALMNDVQEVTSEKDLWEKQGALKVLASLINFQDLLKRAEEEALEDISSEGLE